MDLHGDAEVSVPSQTRGQFSTNDILSAELVALLGKEHFDSRGPGGFVWRGAKMELPDELQHMDFEREGRARWGAWETPVSEQEYSRFA